MQQSQMQRLLFVDDEPRILDAIRRMLRCEASRWETIFASSVDEAIAKATECAPDIVISDVTMPAKSGLDLLREFKQNATLRHVPVIMLTGLGDSSLKRQALELGAVDLLTKPVEAADLRARIENVLKIKNYEDRLRNYAIELESRVAERTRDLEHSRVEILMRLAMAGELRDTDTGRHVVRVAEFSRIIAEQLGLNRHACDELLVTSPLHDIGKVGIPDRILRKPGPLTEAERIEMQQHCRIGYDILRSRGNVSSVIESLFKRSDDGNRLLEMAASIALNHHERWDGKGYPNRLRGEKIPLDARIVAGADVFDALCSPRPYKDAILPQQVRQIMQSESGTHFDPAVWNAMDRCWGALVEIVQKLRDDAPVTGMAA